LLLGVVRIEPDFAMAHRNLGYMLAAQSRLDEAIEQYQQNGVDAYFRANSLHAWPRDGSPATRVEAPLFTAFLRVLAGAKARRFVIGDDIHVDGGFASRTL
jgi:hypothetical protein